MLESSTSWHNWLSLARLQAKTMTNIDFIQIEQKGQVQQIIDEQPPKRLYYSEDGSSVVGRKKIDVIVGTSQGSDRIFGRKNNDILINNGGVSNAKGNAGADTFVLKLGGRMCIRDFRPEDGDTLVIPSDDYYFTRKKGHLVLVCEEQVVAKFNGGSDDFLQFNTEYPLVDID